MKRYGCDMAIMTHEETITFLSEGTRTGHLATTRSDGSPHVAPVWFVMDGDDLVFQTARTSVKGRNMARDPRVALTVDLPVEPYPFVIVFGHVTLSEEDLFAWGERIGARYMGHDRAEEFGRRNGVPGELVVRLTPTKIVSENATSAYS